MALSEADARAAAEAQVRAYCGWIIAPAETVVMTLDGPGTGALLLPSLHVQELTSVVENGTELDPETDYSWSVSGIVRRGDPGCWAVDSQRRWTNALRGIVVELTHGYDEWPVEVLSVIDRLYTRGLEGSGLLTQVGAVSYATDADGIPIGGLLGGLDRAVLAGYKLPVRP